MRAQGGFVQVTVGSGRYSAALLHVEIIRLSDILPQGGNGEGN